MTVPGVERLARSHGFGEVDVLYLDSPVQSFWLDAIPHAVSVARIADLYSAFDGVAPEMLAMERQLIRRVDLVAATSRRVLDHVDALGARRTVYLPNGVEYARFASPDGDVSTVLDSVPPPIVLYVGQLRERLDDAVVAGLAERLPSVSFVFVGPGGLSVRLQGLANIHDLGWQPPEEVPGLMRAADVGLLPLDRARYRQKVDAIHPLKLYQYLAAGLPVVAARTAEVEYMESPALLYDSLDAAESAVRLALDGAVDPAALRDYARRADWSVRLGTLLEAIDGSRAEE